MKTINIFTDGGSRGNPGPAAIGILIKEDQGETLFKLGKQIGITTNNIAEYTAIEEALLIILSNFNFSKTRFIFKMDSLLAVNQLNGKFKINNEAIKEKIKSINKIKLKIIGEIIFKHIPREQNIDADFLVNSSFN